MTVETGEANKMCSFASICSTQMNDEVVVVGDLDSGDKALCSVVKGL